jgi:hypothetical protein
LQHQQLRVERLLRLGGLIQLISQMPDLQRAAGQKLQPREPGGSCSRGSQAEATAGGPGQRQLQPGKPDGSWAAAGRPHHRVDEVWGPTLRVRPSARLRSSASSACRPGQQCLPPLANPLPYSNQGPPSRQ